MKIAIDAGHGLYTSGKRCLKSIDPNETREWWLNQRIANKVVTHLQRCGITTMRTDDTTGKTDVALSKRSQTINSWGADYAVSIHHDSGVAGGKGGGCTVYVYNGAHSVKSDSLQYQVYQAFVAEVGKFGNRASPLLSANFHMVREPNCPAILIECGFMDSAVDTPMILTEEFATKAALGIAKGICKAVGVAWIGETTTQVKEEVDMTEAQVKALIDTAVSNAKTNYEAKIDKLQRELAALQTEVDQMGDISGTGDKPSGWAEDGTEWAKEAGIFKGDGSGNYGWKQFVTREQLAVVLYQYGK